MLFSPSDARTSDRDNLPGRFLVMTSPTADGLPLKACEPGLKAAIGPPGQQTTSTVDPSSIRDGPSPAPLTPSRGLPRHRSAIESISLPALRALTAFEGQVRQLGRFRRAANFVLARDGTDGSEAGPQQRPGRTSCSATAMGNDVLAFVTPEIGNGPFHIVVDTLPSALPLAPAEGWPLWKEPGTLRIGPWALQVGPKTRVWDPNPAWNDVSVQDGALRRLSRVVSETFENRHSPLPPGRILREQLQARTRRLVSALASGDVAAAEASARALAGLGPGLTPSGDDILAGALLGLWARHHPRCQRLAAAVFGAAGSRTTTLSRAFLRAASLGQATERWHRLVEALCSGTGKWLDQAIAQVLAFGATSGLDMLYGFSLTCQAMRRHS